MGAIRRYGWGVNTSDTDSSQIVVYSHERCSACRVVKEFLARQGVQFIVKNVATDAVARDEFLRARFFSASRYGHRWCCGGGVPAGPDPGIVGRVRCG